MFEIPPSVFVALQLATVRRRQPSSAFALPYVRRSRLTDAGNGQDRFDVSL